MEADYRLMGSYLLSNKGVKLWISEHNLESSLEVSGDKKSFLWLYLVLVFLKNYFVLGYSNFCFKKIFFNWRIIALQSFFVFCQTSTWISHRYTYILSLLKLPPVSLPMPPLCDDTEPLFEFPEPRSKFPVALYFTYGNVSFHVTLSIQLTLSSPLPRSISLLSMSVSPLLPCK